MMRDYAKPAGYPEIEFIQNLFVKSTAELAERWYGGVPNARLIAAIVGLVAEPSAGLPL